MPLSKRTTILFPPEVWDELGRVAKEKGTSVAHLVREAAVQRYLAPNKATRKAAVEALAAMRLPVSSWSQMEAETRKGRAGKRA